MIAQFALRLTCGIALNWSLMPRSQVTCGFFRIQMFVTLGLSVLAALTWGQLAGTDDGQDATPARWLYDNGAAACIVMGAISFLGSAVWTLNRRRLGDVLCIALASLASALIISAAWIQSSGQLLRIASELSTAFMLGSMMTAMLLGHWYLTAPTMSIEPLKRLTLFVALAVAARTLVSILALLSAGDQIGGSTHTLWLSLRWIGGIIGPGIVAWMTFRILRYRNTQSATGVLFVGVILTFIGEMTATLLTAETGVPY